MVPLPKLLLAKSMHSDRQIELRPQEYICLPLCYRCSHTRRGLCDINPLAVPLIFPHIRVHVHMYTCTCMFRGIHMYMYMYVYVQYCIIYSIMYNANFCPRKFSLERLKRFKRSFRCVLSCWCYFLISTTCTCVYIHTYQAMKILHWQKCSHYTMYTCTCTCT